MIDPGKRLKILTKSEIGWVYGLPDLTQEERAKYFILEPLEKEILDSFRGISTKVYFLLQLGYFKAKKLFFVFGKEEVQKDIEYIFQNYFPDSETKEFQNIDVTKPTRLAQQTIILKLFNYRNCNEQIREALQKKVNYLTTVSIKPIFVFRELVKYLENHRIVISGYSVIQMIIGKALINEKTRLEVLVSRYINKEIYSSLNNFLTAESGLHEVTIIKKDQRSFNWKEIIKETDKRKVLKPLYKFACGFLPKLGISNENIKHYASLINYYTIPKLKRMSPATVYVYLLCFIFIRYQKSSNNLINSLIYHVNNYNEEAKTNAKETVYRNQLEGNQNLKKAGKVLNLFTDENIPDNTEFREVKERAFNILDKDKFSFVSRYMVRASFDEKEYEWDHYKKLSPAFKKNLRPPFMTVDFESQTRNDPLMKAVKFIKSAFLKNKSLSQLKAKDFPLDFIPGKLKCYLFKNMGSVLNGKVRKNKQLDTDKYEFLIYQSLRNCLESGDVYCRDSTQFRSFEDELIDKKYWEENRDKILEDLDYTRLKMPIDELLSNLKKELETKIVHVDNRIKSGQNKYIKIAKRGDSLRWSLPYKKPEDTENHTFYSHLPQIDIGDVLLFVNEQCGFIKAFTHILSKYAKTEADNYTIIGSIVALATNMGLITMGETSDISFQALYTATKNFIRLETLRDANDIISNKISQNPFFRYYDIEDGIIHSSSDGQRMEVQISTINARYSPKFFGLKKGVSSYTLVANHVPINAKIIGANEHESHYVFDILFNNTTDIKSDRHSTDTHGTNKTNHITLYMFDHIFAPRYAKLSSRADKICGFKDLVQYKDLIIKPGRKARRQIIVDESDNILRIMVSLALKSTTQSIIVRKLSSHARKNRTLKAFWELNDIVNSIYILDYIDDLILRRGVHRSLNRGESYHKLKRAVTYAYSGKFRVKTEAEQQIWDECSRLVCNCIIFYNIWILSTLHDQLKARGRESEAKFLGKISPIAWRHTNLRGHFKFKKGKSIDLNEIMNRLLKLTASEYSIEIEEYFN